MKRTEFEQKWSEVENLDSVLQTFTKETYEETMNNTLALLVAYGRAYMTASDTEQVVCQTMQEFICDYRKVLRGERYGYSWLNRI